ncbi:MAG: ABC transporter substrate-binding protein [Bacteroidetes bacterium]|nr:ABC transporter substrate-binding protein [Bacteroidota bacterium]MCL5026895.1 ABC transporter substrate-binding protein [Chloroflexota bacterium]
MKRMSRLVGKLFVVAMVSSLLLSCAPAAPTAAPPKPAAAAPTPTSAPAAPTSKPGPTGAPAAAATPTAAAKIKRGGTLTEANSATYPTLDPQLSSAFTLPGHRMMFDALFRYELVDEKTAKQEAVGELVDTWQMVDPKTFLFKLRQGVKFHDGSAWNADVAKWNLDRMMTNKKSTAKTYVEAINSVDVVDPSTIRVNLKTPSAALLVNLSGVVGPVSIVSKEAVDKLGEDGFNAHPVGSGPMQFVEWLPDNRLTLKKFDGYWRMGADGKPLPYIDGSVHRVINDPAVTLVEMKAGTVDVTAEPEAKDVASIQANPSLVYWQHPSAINGRTLGVNPKNGPFANNLKLRQSLLYAIDRGSMAKTLSFGIGEAYNYVYWSLGYLGYDASLPYYNFDPAKSKQLLAEAGYPNGTDITVSVIARPLDQRIGEILKQMWDQVGIRTRIDSLERLAWIDKLRNYNFDVGFWGGIVGADPDQNTRNLATGATGNWSGWSDPRMDKCLEDGRSTYDPKQRDEIYKRCQRLIYDEAYVSGLYLWHWGVAYNKAVKNVKSQWTDLDLREAWLDR